MKKLFLPVILTVFFSSAGAQILPPNFLCVKADTLFWELPANNCGTFNSYDIYFSQAPTGPFNLLATVTNASQTAYFHANPSGNTFYYYLISNYNCPSQTAIPSDTLDNRPPEVSALRSVSVEGDNVRVVWTPSPSPEVFAYVIYRQTSIGVVPIDTVYSGSNYLDQSASPGSLSETYLVNAIDRCGITSIFDVKHSTIFLEGSLSPCEQGADLKWNLYKGWGNGIGAQELWASINGAAPVMLLTLDQNVTSYKYRGLVDGSDYCFYILAKEQGTGEMSISNQVCLVADVVRPVKDFFLKNFTINGAGNVEITWNWDDSAEIKSMEILRSNQNNGYQSVFSQNVILPLQRENTFEDANGDPSAGSLYYKIKAKDACDTVSFSTYGATIFLKGTAEPGNQNVLDWTGFILENAVVTSYELYRELNGNTVLLATLGNTDFTYTDPFDPSITGGTGACYYIIAKATVSTPDGGKLDIQSRSNTVCVEQPLGIYIPNAFAPQGHNKEFKPFIVPPEVASFDMRIFDRYGQELFVSKDPDMAWDGKAKGQDMPQGAYTYRIHILKMNGKEELRIGSVLLLR